MTRFLKSINTFAMIYSS